MSLSKILFAATTSLIFSGGIALADGEPDPAAPVNSPNAAETESATPVAETGSVGRPLTLEKGKVAIHVDIGIGLSKDSTGKPFNIAPDIWYGVSDKFTIGLVHGTGLCLSGDGDGGCAKVYNDVGVEGLLSLKRDAKMEIAARVGFDALQLSPDFLGRVSVGVSFQYVAAKLGIYVHPAISIGVTKRDAGNKEFLSVPVKVAYQAAPKLAVYLHTGIAGVTPFGGQFGVNPVLGAAPLDVDGASFGDFFAIPLGIGGLYSVSEKLDVGAEFLFPAIAGSDAASADYRALILMANIRL